jgi:hypothetical protein
MQQNKFIPIQKQKTMAVSRSVMPMESNPAQSGFAVSPDEVARRAYFTYVNEGSPPGRDVQHWLEAEEQLLAERNLTRIHGYHYRT